MLQKGFDYIHLSPTLLPDPSTLPYQPICPPHTHTFKRKNSIFALQAVQHIFSWMCDLQWSVVNITKASPIKNPEHFFQQLPTAHSSLTKDKNGRHPSVCWNCLGPDPCKFHLCCKPLWVHVCSCPAVSRKHCLLVVTPSMSLTFFPPLLPPLSLGGKCVM